MTTGLGGARPPAPGAALLLGLALLVGSCGPRAAAPTVTLRFWGMGREGEVVGELARDFERENPGIRIEVQQVPWTAAHEKLLTGFVGHSMPDLFQLGNTWVSEFVILGALEPFDSWLTGSPDIRRESYFGGCWDACIIDGRCYGLPWYVDTRLVFYRRDFLKQAGYDSLPGDWAGWKTAMQAIKRNVGPDRFVIFLPINEWAPPIALGLQAGSPLLTDQATRGAFQGPEWRTAFDFYLSLFRDGLAPPVGNTEVANLYQEFARGYFCMYITGPWNVGEFRRRLPAELQDVWMTAPIPGPTGPASGVSLVGGSTLSIYRESRHKEAAWKFVAYLARPDVQVRFNHLTGDLPARVEAWQDSALAADPYMLAFREQLERVVPLPNVPEWEQVAYRVQERVEQAVRGAAPPDSVLAELDRDVARVLEKRRWLIETGWATAAAPEPAAGARR